MLMPEWALPKVSSWLYMEGDERDREREKGKGTIIIRFNGAPAPAITMSRLLAISKAFTTSSGWWRLGSKSPQSRIPLFLFEIHAFDRPPLWWWGC
ncbi:hypothetical protein CRG98_029197 [Punica granatum]|uniref:Uncharacterized protein n=1 Tax=Punica granatum TaxID=22663 RepID=A0A2I0J2I6_PUNGR|nr:hypothetical protein CRG98_029197 [Punica granatum]